RLSQPPSSSTCNSNPASSAMIQGNSESFQNNSANNENSKGNSSSTWKQTPGVHTVKQSMKEDQFYMKKIKVMSQHSSNYRDQTVAMVKTKVIRQQVAEAEVTHMRTK
ncbi:hypothetical protein VP01_5741g2, partial [Puccinia sorghi]